MLMIDLPVWHQYHRFLLVDSLQGSWSICHRSTLRVLGLWPGQLRLCLARDLDH